MATIKINECPNCRTAPVVLHKTEDKHPFRVSQYVSCRCSEGERANSGLAAIKLWNAGNRSPKDDCDFPLKAKGTVNDGNYKSHYSRDRKKQ